MENKVHTNELNVMGFLNDLANANIKPDEFSFQDFLKMAKSGGAPKFRVHESIDSPAYFEGFMIGQNGDGTCHMVLENETFVRAKMENDKFVIEKSIPGTN